MSQDSRHFWPFLRSAGLVSDNLRERSGRLARRPAFGGGPPIGADAGRGAAQIRAVTLKSYDVVAMTCAETERVVSSVNRR
jgi:hypothetical protein